MAITTEGGNAKGSRNKKVKTRNEARKKFRFDNPKFKGSQLKRWPLEDNFG